MCGNPTVALARRTPESRCCRPKWWSGTYAPTLMLALIQIRSPESAANLLIIYGLSPRMLSEQRCVSRRPSRRFGAARQRQRQSYNICRNLWRPRSAGGPCDCGEKITFIQHAYSGGYKYVMYVRWIRSWRRGADWSEKGYKALNPIICVHGTATTFLYVCVCVCLCKSFRRQNVYVCVPVSTLSESVLTFFREPLWASVCLRL